MRKDVKLFKEMKYYEKNVFYAHFGDNDVFLQFRITF